MTGSLLLLLAAPPSLADVPPLDRGRPDFYGAVADRPVTVVWAVEAGSDIVLSLTVRGAANPGEVRKPDVKRLLAGRFQVLDRPDPPPAADAARFEWAVRPVPGADPTIPGLAFAYYRPSFPEGRRMPTAFAEPITVPVPQPPAVALPEVPPSGVTVPGWAWLVPAGLALPAVWAGVPLARRRWPDAARRAEQRRVREVREVLDSLRLAKTDADPAGATARAVRQYLAARPGEGERFADLLHQCDATRFGRNGDGHDLPARAAERVSA